jgi:hypothetical protein
MAEVDKAFDVIEKPKKSVLRWLHSPDKYMGEVRLPADPLRSAFDSLEDPQPG